MRSLRSRISIQSNPLDLYHVLTDFSGYEKWNPWLKDVQGEAKEGTRVTVRPNMVSLLGIRLTYRLEEISPHDLLRWKEEAWFDFLFRTVREYQIYTKMGGSSIYSVSLRFQGPLAPIVSLFYRKTVKQGLRQEAEALRDYCETHFPLLDKGIAIDPDDTVPVNLDDLDL